VGATTCQLIVLSAMPDLPSNYGHSWERPPKHAGGLGSKIYALGLALRAIQFSNLRYQHKADDQRDQPEARHQEA
jgi:hypothetical protein